MVILVVVVVVGARDIGIRHWSYMIVLIAALIIAWVFLRPVASHCERIISVMLAPFWMLACLIAWTSTCYVDYACDFCHVNSQQARRFELTLSKKPFSERRQDCEWRPPGWFWVFSKKNQTNEKPPSFWYPIAFKCWLITRAKKFFVMYAEKGDGQLLLSSRFNFYHN